MITEIKLTDSIKIPYGNMAFILEASGFETLYEKCVNLEQSLKYDYKACARNFRFVIEEFVVCEEGKKINPDIVSDKSALERVRKEISINQKDDWLYNVDTFCRLFVNSPNVELVKETVIKYTGKESYNNNAELRNDLRDIVRAILKFSSKNSHSGSVPGALIPNEGNCRIYLKQLFVLLAAYYNHQKKYDGGILPFRDYYPVPKKLCMAFGIVLPEGKKFFVKNGVNGTEYYIFTSADDILGDTQKRDIETINKLWMENIDSPQNIIDNIRFESNKNGTDFRYWISKLPSFPQSLTDDFINSLTDNERMMVVGGLIKGINSMHRAEPPLYHRSISAASFVVCKVKDRLKPILISFNSTKDFDAEYTVFYAVEDKLGEQNAGDLIFAPELSDENYDISDYDWEKIDVYALGRTIIKVMTCRYDAEPDECSCLNAEQMQMIKSMIADDYRQRPSLNKISYLF